MIYVFYEIYIDFQKFILKENIELKEKNKELVYLKNYIELSKQNHII